MFVQVHLSLRTQVRGAVAALLAATALGLAVTPAQAQDTATSADFVGEEIVVTATRRETGVLDVPASISVLSGELLDRQGARGFADYLANQPGIGLTDVGGGQTRIGIRGVANLTGSEYGTADSVEAVGIYLNEIPISGAGSAPDLAIYDLARVEVLKGPQGTLFGEGAMSGVVRLITNSPNFLDFEARGEASGATIKSGGDEWMVRGLINVPIISEAAALRVVGSWRRSGGFIDNVAVGEKNVNSSEHWSVRAVLGAKLGSDVSAELMYLRDDNRLDDFNDINPALGGLRQNLGEDRSTDQLFQLYALTVEANLGFADLVSASSYNKINRLHRPRFQFLGFPQETLPSQIKQTGFVQELRLVSQGDNRFDWIVGGFYRERDQSICGELDVPGGAAVLGTSDAGITRPCPVSRSPFILYRDVPNEGFNQLAFYGEASFELLPGLDLTGGARWFKEKTSYTQVLVASAPLSAINNTSFVKASVDDLIFKAGLSYRINPRILTYFTFSQGFRSGGPNLNSGIAPTIPPLFRPDTVNNYELGVKGSFLDGRVTINAAGFYTDWQDIQLLDANVVVVGGSRFGYISNQGQARIYGFDTSVAVTPTQGLDLGVSVAYVNSKLTKASATSQLLVGQELPNSPPLTFSTFAAYGTALSDNVDLNLRADFAFTDNQSPDPLVAPGVGASLGTGWRNLKDNSRLNLTAGLDFDRFGFDIFALNVLNEIPEYGANVPASGGGVIIGTPRTIGARLRVAF
ncbi:TonB-dependent receptor [uncultured Sphingosinicella sp.]|uniref:TonB-dependent receptor n=1 Tax=uncultured Sphingosinicella sp. TaxID=478748 RepID=UPI0030DA1C7C|tara:strand:+ start:8630 stop:10876 length:2247 start_codon:yes stop_codon:yes gene_type:complete